MFLFFKYTLKYVKLTKFSSTCLSNVPHCSLNFIKMQLNCNISVFRSEKFSNITIAISIENLICSVHFTHFNLYFQVKAIVNKDIMAEL